MDLTGPLFGWTVWILAVALFAWVIIAWPRSAGRGVLPVLRRTGYQLGLITLVVLAVAVTLNDEYGWYANWGDLGSLFSGTAAGAVIGAGAAPADAAGSLPADQLGPGAGHQSSPLSLLGDQGQLDLLAHPGPLGQYHDYTVVGTASRITGTVSVWFPAAYTDPRMADHRFPVIEAFHGVPGTTRQLSYNMAIGRQVAQQVAAGTLADSVVVMPAYAPHEVDTECVDGGAGQLQMEQWITQDVTNWVDHRLRVIDDRRSWATFGLSAGAWCASMLAMLHPDLYSAAISLGGYYQPTFEKPYVPFAPHSPQWNHYDLLRIAHDAPPKVALWVQTSKADTISYGTAVQLLGTARPPLSVTADVLPNAGHRLSVWIALIPQTLRWLGSQVPGFHP